ncbi:MAG: hypothetical protein V4594_24135 [Bacteroidota bacterium]
MNSVKKFTTFNELKSVEDKTVIHERSVEKHHDFEKFILSVGKAKVLQKNQAKSKR